MILKFRSFSLCLLSVGVVLPLPLYRVSCQGSNQTQGNVLVEIHAKPLKCIYFWSNVLKEYFVGKYSFPFWFNILPFKAKYDLGFVCLKKIKTTLFRIEIMGQWYNACLPCLRYWVWYQHQPQNWQKEREKGKGEERGKENGWTEGRKKKSSKEETFGIQKFQLFSKHFCFYVFY